MIKITVNVMSRKNEIVQELTELKKQSDRIHEAMQTAFDLGLERVILELSVPDEKNLKRIAELERELGQIEYEEMIDVIAEERLIMFLIEGGLI